MPIWAIRGSRKLEDEVSQLHVLPTSRPLQFRSCFLEVVGWGEGFVVGDVRSWTSFGRVLNLRPGLLGPGFGAVVKWKSFRRLFAGRGATPLSIPTA